MAKDTAESKLLKLIEETDAKDKTTGAPAAAPDAAKVLSSVSSVGVGAIAIPPLLQKVLGLFVRRGQPSEGFGLRIVNQVLLLVVIVIAGFFVMDFSRGMKESQTKVQFDVEQVAFDPNSEVLPAVRDVFDYIASVSSRNIFKPFEKKVEETKIVAPIENQRIRDKVLNFKLVGISWLSSPETATVMIEDKSTSVTHFLKTGEDLQGVKVDVIYADRVEVSFQGEKLTINL